jgi:predicted lipoprotein with Yx(FWY)xxD motif
MKVKLGFIALFAAGALAACGGGGSSGGGSPMGGGPPATTAPANSSLPLQQTVAGAAAWVAPANNHTLYQLSADGKNSSVCTSASGCTGIWPPMAAAAGSVTTGNFTPFMRSDGTMQWAYNGHPLYTYSGDSGADQTNGNGIVSFGGTWSVGRPATAGGATPQPSSPPCSGPYC